jgi:hypothetical protein
MIKKITIYLLFFILGLIMVFGFINPISKKYTFWNLIYISKDIYK